PTECFESRDVDRDVVVDDEDRASAACPCVADVVNHALDRQAMEVAAAHLDDRAEAAVERAAARGLDDVDGPAHVGVAGQDSSLAARWLDLAALERRDRSRQIALYAVRSA